MGTCKDLQSTAAHFTAKAEIKHHRGNMRNTEGRDLHQEGCNSRPNGGKICLAHPC